MYARRLTKEELMKSGITKVTEDGHVFCGELEKIPSIHKQGYLMHNIYEIDENGNYVKVPAKKSASGYYYKNRSIGLHRLIWAWFNGEVPEGMIVDHINNKHDTLEDYELSNLQLLTPGENVLKDKTNWHTWELKCKLNKPRSFYEDKLIHYTTLYEQAKKDHDAELAHRLRCNIAQTRARLRYYDSHIEEHKEIMAIEEAAEKAANAKAIEEAKTKKALKAEHIKILKALASEAKSKGDKHRWHNLIRVHKNYDAFTQTQIIKIIEKETKKETAC